LTNLEKGLKKIPFLLQSESKNNFRKNKASLIFSQLFWRLVNKIWKQAEAELCQAQVQLGLAMLAVTRKKLMAYLQMLGHILFQKKFRLSSIKYSSILPND
jgi:hypothetical protein